MKWVFTTLTAVFLVLTVWLAAEQITAHGDAYDASQRRLLEVRDGVDGELSSLVRSGTSALLNWEPGSLPPSPLTRAVEVSGGEPPPWTVPFGDGDVRVGFDRGALVVVVTRGAGYLHGEVSRTALLARLADRAEIGPPAPEEGFGPDGPPPRYSLVEILDGTGTALWQSEAEIEDEEDSAKVSVTTLLGGTDGPVRSHRAVQRGEPSAEGEVPDFRGSGGERVFGCWDRWVDAPELWIAGELRQDVAVAHLSGWPLKLAGEHVADVHAWHIAIGLLVLCMLVTVFLGLRGRYEQMGVLVRVLSFVRPYRIGVVGVFALGFVATLANSSYVILGKVLFDDVLGRPDETAVDRLWNIGYVVVALAFVLGVCGYLRGFLHNYYATSIMADLRLAIGRKIAGLPLSYFNRIRAGELIARIENDAAASRKVFNQIFKTVALEPFQMAAMATTGFVLNWRLALVLLGLPVLVAPLFRIAKKVKKRSSKRQAQRADISHVMFQILVGMKVIKAFRGEEREALRLDAANRRFIDTARKVFRLTALSESLLDVLQMIGAAVVMVGGGYLVLGGSVSVGDLMAFVMVVQKTYTSAKKLTSTANQLVDASAGVTRVYEVLDAENELEDGPRELPPGPLSDGIRMESVSFAYEEKNVLDDVDLFIPAGQVVAVVGPTGAGKTTLCDLVARFYDPTSGAVRYDGVDVREFTVGSLMDSVAIVTQDAFLFNTSIADNIRYARPDATGAEVRAAAAAAFVHDEIENMEGGYQKMAGERGTKVSGGQRQRITIARALLKDAPVLILDEATSALDSHAEKQVQAALDKLMSGRTVIVVAHRLSTIRGADKVVVMERGRVLEEGAPDDLLADPNGRFRRMYDLQMGRPPEDGDAGTHSEPGGLLGDAPAG